MNSKKRLLSVLNGQMPDRVPVSTYELVGFNSQAFENNDPSYTRLVDAIREKTDCICMWGPESNETFLQSASDVEIKVETYREGNAQIYEKKVQTPKGQLKQTTRIIDSIHTTWEVEHWCKSLEDVDKALSVHYEPLRYDFSDGERIRNEVNGNGIIMTSLSDPLCVAAELMNFGDYTVWAMTEQEHFKKTLEIIHKRIMENLRNMLEIQAVDLYRICGSEYATPPYLPPELFKKYAVPYVSEMVDVIHSKGAKARLHCHGKIEKVLDMIASIGADAIDPCEGPPDGDIELSEVKSRVGGDRCIFGNLQLKLLEIADKDEVIAEVKRCMDNAKKGGRYVIMPTAAPINSPLSAKTEDNYFTFIEAALRYGKY